MERTRYTLIQRLKSQEDEAAWDSFVEAYKRYIYTVLRRMGISHEESSDLQQEILLKLWQKLPDFDYQPDKAKFRTWLCRVIKNTALNRIKKLQNERKRLDSFREEADAVDAEVDSLMAHEWQTYVTNQAMERIRDKFSEQSILVFERSLQGVGIEQLAKDFGLRENSIYKIRNRVKERLIMEIAELRRDLE